MDEAVEAALRETVISLNDLQATRLTNVAGFSLYVFDSLLVSEEERRYIWQANWSVGKVLYIFIRYSSLLTSSLSVINSTSTFSTGQVPAPSITYCRAASSVEGYLGIIGLSAIHVIFALRTYAIWNKNKTILMCLLLLTFAAGAIMMQLWSEVYPHVIILPHTSTSATSLVGCLPTCDNCAHWQKFFHTPLIIYDFLVFLLTIWKTYHFSKTQVNTRLVTLLWLDGTVYFVLIFVATIANMFLWGAATSSLIQINVAFFRTFVATMCCRLILNVRGALTEAFPVGTESTFAMEPMTRISQRSTMFEFAHATGTAAWGDTFDIPEEDELDLGEQLRRDDLERDLPGTREHSRPPDSDTKR